MSMTLEQAIKILHPDTSLDTLNTVLVASNYSPERVLEAENEAILLACEIMQREVERQEKEAKPLILHFGEGAIGVSTCKSEESDVWNELLLWNPRMRQDIGNQIPIADGTTTDDVEVYARLFFHKPESAQVVVGALNRIIESYGKPLNDRKV